MSSKEIEDRRRRAREAAQDAYAANHNALHVSEHAIDEAIKTSTQVKITDESTRSLISFGMTNEAARSVLRWSLTELGFEVIE